MPPGESKFSCANGPKTFKPPSAESTRQSSPTSVACIAGSQFFPSFDTSVSPASSPFVAIRCNASSESGPFAVPSAVFVYQVVFKFIRDFQFFQF